METIMKNIAKGTVLDLASEITYQDGQIASKTLVQNDFHNLTLFAFEKNEEISTHESGGDALVVALDGQGKITIDGEEHILNAGQAIVMPAKRPHAVYAAERFKMMLAVFFPEAE
ncbi:MAG: cupin domain-containing protein [Christensenellaceae bacterium]|jgi:quercetin dioxygenase-like cupin family protein